MKEKAKAILLTLLTPKSIILGVASYNFILIWMTARNWSLGCFICPWYSEWSFSNEPTRSLIAACGLCLGMRWSYVAAIGLNGFTLFQAMSWYAELIRHGEFLESWKIIWPYGLHPLFSLHIQYILAGVILVYASVCLGKSIGQRSSMLR